MRANGKTRTRSSKSAFHFEQTGVASAFAFQIESPTRLVMPALMRAGTCSRRFQTLPVDAVKFWTPRVKRPTNVQEIRLVPFFTVVSPRRRSDCFYLPCHSTVELEKLPPIVLVLRVRRQGLPPNPSVGEAGQRTRVPVV